MTVHSTQPIKLLILAFDYRPNVGGVSSATFELAKAVCKLPDIEGRLLAPRSENMKDDALFDSHGYFNTRRIKIPMNNFISIFVMTWYLFLEVRKCRPHVILNSLWLPCGVASWFVSPVLRYYNIPYFTVVHGVEICESSRTLKKWIRMKLRWIKNRVIRGSKRVFSVSQFTADQVVSECKIGSEKIKVIYNGVDPAVFKPIEKSTHFIKKYGLEGKVVFLTISRLEDYKGVDYVLKAFSKVMIERPEFYYLVCGDGPDRKHLETLRREYRLDHHVGFLGKVTDESLNDIYNVSDVFILNSRHDRVAPNFEGFGIVLLEAAACGKPSIAGKSGGMPEVVSHLETGWLVNPEDEHELSQVIIQAMDSESTRRQFGISARNRIIEKFTWDHIAASVIAEMRSHVRN